MTESNNVFTQIPCMAFNVLRHKKSATVTVYSNHLSSLYGRQQPVKNFDLILRVMIPSFQRKMMMNSCICNMSRCPNANGVIIIVNLPSFVRNCQHFLCHGRIFSKIRDEGIFARLTILGVTGRRNKCKNGGDEC